MCTDTVETVTMPDVALCFPVLTEQAQHSNTEQEMARIDYLTLDQAAAELGVHRDTVRRAISSGKLPAKRFGRLIRIKSTDLDKALDEIR